LVFAKRKKLFENSRNVRSALTSTRNRSKLGTGCPCEKVGNEPPFFFVGNH